MGREPREGISSHERAARETKPRTQRSKLESIHHQLVLLMLWTFLFFVRLLLVSSIKAHYARRPMPFSPSIYYRSLSVCIIHCTLLVRGSLFNPSVCWLVGWLVTLSLTCSACDSSKVPPLSLRKGDVVYM